MHIMLLGAPGVGKGTQAQFIVDRYQVPQISTGDILRAEVAAGSDLGRQAKTVMDRGELVSDDLILQIVEKRLHEPDCAGGFILDGFPRTIPQAEGLSLILKRMGDIELHVFEIDVPDEEILRRLMARGRADHRKETILNRLEIYHTSTAPLIEYYMARNHFNRIDGYQPIEAVAEEIEGVLQTLAARQVNS